MEEAKHRIRNAQRVIVYTGAGMSVDSNIAPFRKKGGLWNLWEYNSPIFWNYIWLEVFSRVLLEKIFIAFFETNTFSKTTRRL